MFLPQSDLVCLSVIFSWNATIAAEIANRIKEQSEVWAGGPGLFALGNWWEKQTGLKAHQGLDQRFEYQRGNYRMGFASRGCSVGCYFCIVPLLEGTEYKLDWDFVPAPPILCDNNLSDLPVDFQEHIINRYRETNTTLIDANSGFEPRSFDDGTYHRWKKILRGPWRFALDTISEEEQVKRMMHILKDISATKKQIYCLIGNEPMEVCYYRTQRIIEWGGEPYCQPYMPLNALRRDQFKINHDWTPSLLRDFARYFNRHLWRNIDIREYKPRKNEALPFKEMKTLGR